MFIEDLKEALCRRGRLVRLASMFVIATAGFASVQADDWDDDCERPPTCEVLGLNDNGRMVFPECNPNRDERHRCENPSFNIWVDLVCPDSDEMWIEFRVDGKRVERRSVEDQANRQQAYFEIPNWDQYKEGAMFRVDIKVIDKETGASTSCWFKVMVTCGKPPACYFKGVERPDRDDRRPMIIYDVKPGDTLPEYEICARSRCGNRARIEMFARPPFMDPIGHKKGSKRKKVCISTKANDIVESGYAEGTYWAKYRCTDLRSGLSRVIVVGYRYTDPEPEPCSDDPICEILDGDSIMVDIDGTGEFTVCGSSPCDDCDVTIEMTSGPSFVMLGTADVPGNDNGICNSYLATPGVGDEGSHTAVFTVTDCEGNTSECSIEINVPAPLLACQENEDQLPNDSFGDASVIDAGECADAFGVNLHGVLDKPVFRSGDVDYFRVVGLTPDEVYVATIVAGLTAENEFTDTMLGWFAAEGIVVAMDDNSGPLRGYSMITFTADEDGVATLAVSGHGDNGFNGSMDGSMPYEEYGFGGYMLSIRAEIGDVMPVERQADLNGDGVVNTADLGMLIGVFGASAN